MPKVTRSEMWYRKRLGRYFDEHYIEYENVVMWSVDPAPNQWVFDIPGTDLRIKLTCDDQGNVTEEPYPLKGGEHL